MQKLQLVAPLRAEDQDHLREGILAQRRQAVRTTPKIHRLGRQQNPHPSRDGDHASETRTARSTALSSLGSTPGETRTTAPASTTSSPGPAAAPAAASGSARIGTNAASPRPTARLLARASRRHVNSCCGAICQRRATAETTAPGASLSATTCALVASSQTRRRPGPVSTSTRRYSPPFMSRIMSALLSARSSQPRPDIESGRVSTWKKGLSPALTALQPGHLVAQRLVLDLQC